MQVGSGNTSTHRLIDQFLQRYIDSFPCRVPREELYFFHRRDGLRNTVVCLLQLRKIRGKNPSALDVAENELVPECSDPAAVYKPIGDGSSLVVIVDRDRICEAILHCAAEDVRRQWEQLVQFSATRSAVLPISFPLHPAIVLAVANDVDLLDVI